MKVKQIKSLLIAGFIGAGACFSGIAAMGFSHVMTAYAGEGVEINETNFPDTEFRKYVSVNVDKDGDGVLSETEIEDRKEISIYDHPEGGKWVFRSLEGIRFFTALESLDCSNSELGALDLSQNTLLKKLTCTYCDLESLDVSSNTALISLDCGVNRLSSLDVSSNTALESLSCYSNALSSLDVSNIRHSGIWSALQTP